MLPRYRCTDARDRSGRRMIDANAGAPNEWPPTPRTAGGVPVAGGVNPEEVFAADRRRIRISGRDQESGEHFGAELYLPHGGRGYGSSPASPRDAAIGDAALHNLENRDPFSECSGLRAWQRALDAHYAKG